MEQDKIKKAVSLYEKFEKNISDGEINDAIANIDNLLTIMRENNTDLEHTSKLELAKEILTNLNK